MTNLEAIRSYIEPYEVTDGKLRLHLEEVGLQPNQPYVAIRDLRTMGMAVIETLKSLLPLKQEKDNGSSITYDKDGLLALIKRWQAKAGIADDRSDKPQNFDMTNRW